MFRERIIYRGAQKGIIRHQLTCVPVICCVEAVAVDITIVQYYCKEHVHKGQDEPRVFVFCSLGACLVSTWAR